MSGSTNAVVLRLVSLRPAPKKHDMTLTACGNVGALSFERTAAAECTLYSLEIQ